MDFLGIERLKVLSYWNLNLCIPNKDVKSWFT